MTNSGLKKVELFNIDSNRPATVKQLYAVAKHFAKIHDSSAVWKFSKVFGAILIKFQTEHVETPITMGDVNNFLNLKKIPVKFVKAINTAKPKVSKKVAVKTSKEVGATKQPKTTTKPTASKKASEMSVSEFQSKIESLNNRVNKLESDTINIAETVCSLAEKTAKAEKKMQTFEAKLDILMAWLETDPEAL